MRFFFADVWHSIESFLCSLSELINLIFHAIAFDVHACRQAGCA